MKQIILAVVLLFVASAANATLVANTLVVERVTTITNGTSNGQSIASHAMMQRLGTAANCTEARSALNNKASELTVGGKTVNTITLASCIAVDYATQY